MYSLRLEALDTATELQQAQARRRNQTSNIEQRTVLVAVCSAVQGRSKQNRTTAREDSCRVIWYTVHYSTVL
jgi:hypothetical protein